MKNNANIDQNERDEPTNDERLILFNNGLNHMQKHNFD